MLITMTIKENWCHTWDARLNSADLFYHKRLSGLIGVYDLMFGVVILMTRLMSASRNGHYVDTSTATETLY